MGSRESLLDQLTALAAEQRPQRHEPAWLGERRAHAQRQLEKRGLPNKRLESWHYSAGDFWLQQFGQRHSLVPLTPAEQIADLHASIDGALPAGHQLQFSHGYLVNEKIVGGDREKVSLQPLSQIDDATRDALKLAFDVDSSVDSLADLATALAPEPWLLTVSAGATLEKPLLLSHIAAQTGLQISQLIVWVRDNADATLLESFHGGCDDYLHVAHAKLKLERGAKLTYLRLQHEGETAHHLGSVEASVGRDAALRTQLLLGGERIDSERNRIRVGFYVGLDAPGAEFTARSAFAADAQQHVDFHFTVDHRADHGRSDVLVHGLADDKSRGVVNGRIHIAANTRGNDGRFTSHNLLLSNSAEIDAKPELEIYADEVACSHGATIGQLDEEQLLYLRSRGIDEQTAIALMKEGFLTSGLLDCGNAALNGFLRGQLLARVGGELSL